MQEYRYLDYHMLTAGCFPPEERRKVIRVEEGFPPVWVTREPLDPETVRRLELFEERGEND